MSPQRPKKRGNYSKIAFLSPFITLIIHRRGDFLQAQRGNVSFPEFKCKEPQSSGLTHVATPTKLTAIWEQFLSILTATY